MSQMTKTSQSPTPLLATPIPLLSPSTPHPFSFPTQNTPCSRIVSWCPRSQPCMMPLLRPPSRPDLFSPLRSFFSRSCPHSINPNKPLAQNFHVSFSDSPLCPMIPITQHFLWLHCCQDTPLTLLNLSQSGMPLFEHRSSTLNFFCLHCVNPAASANLAHPATFSHLVYQLRLELSLRRAGTRGVSKSFHGHSNALPPHLGPALKFAITHFVSPYLTCQTAQ